MGKASELKQLLRSKEMIELVIAEHISTRHANHVLPEELEQEFWRLNVERTRQNTVQFFWQGIFTFAIFALFLLPSDYLLIEKDYFKFDLILCFLSLLNVGLGLLLFWFFAKYKPFRAYFYPAACIIVFSTIITATLLFLSVKTETIQHQAMLLASFLYMLGFILSGIKPIHMLWIGLSSSFVIIVLLLVLGISLDLVLLIRAFLGSCIIGFSISVMLSSKDKRLFLNEKVYDINEKILRIQTSELLHLSQFDELTQVSNRRTFDEMFDLLLTQSYQYQTSLAVLFIDIDYFKNYNDFYGHLMGDEVISSIAQTIKNTIRHMDFVARYGGEEFVVLLPETSRQGAYAVASNIYKAVEKLKIPHADSLVAPHVTISLGLTVYSGIEKIRAEDLIQTADQALYRAKQLGRNQIYYQEYLAQAD